eukprot:69378-Pelagomonas_calceolata.AAC.1
MPVNIKKSEVVCFNSRAETLPQMLYDGDNLPYTDSFRYLGMVCNNRLNLSTTAEAVLKICIAGTYRVKNFAHYHNLKIKLAACAHLALENICYPSRN